MSSPVQFNKERLSRLVRGVVWSVISVLTAPSVAALVDQSSNPTVKLLWTIGFTAAASWTTSTVAKRFGDPTTATFK